MQVNGWHHFYGIKIKIGWVSDSDIAGCNEAAIGRDQPNSQEKHDI